jgi:hypothetical protein
MRIAIRIAKPVSYFLALALLLVEFCVHEARAAMVGTETVLNVVQEQNDRERLRNFFDRRDVQAAMGAQGIDPAEAKARVDCLSDIEVANIAGRLDQLPAGGDGVSMFIGASVFIFVLLLITDLLGLTHVFPFVNHPRR